MAKKKTEKSAQVPQNIYKKTEFELMLELIEGGLWRTTNLSRALHVDTDTITKWKKEPLAQEAHRQAILKNLKKRFDPEKILSELGIESDPEKLRVEHSFSNLTEQELDAVIKQKTRELGITQVAGGKAEANQG